jgi:1L-myo-inositol 1-phosphate cytidylyltransferase / CDP-L-myo-inositol myo-inositolphosphotransferase
MERPFYLVFSPGLGDPGRRVAGLNLPLRSALLAQQAGASGIVVENDSVVPGQLLDEPRLLIPVVTALPSDAVGISVTSTEVIHRSDLARMERDQLRTGTVVPARPSEFSTDPFWFPPLEVTDSTTARKAERALFRSLRKREDGYAARWLNRYISLAVSRVLAKTTITPNQISVTILGMGLLGAVVAAQGTYFALLLGATLFQAQSILDGCDGELSRVTFRGSHVGEWLDTIGDDLTNYSFFLGAGLGLYRTTDNPLFLVAGVVAMTAGFIGSGIEYAYLIRIGSGDLLKYPLSQATTERRGPLGIIAPLFKRDSFVLLTWLCALFDRVGIALVVFAVGALFILSTVIATEIRMAREKRARPEP